MPQSIWILVQVFLGVSILAVAFYALGLIKKAFIDRTFTVSRVTDDGESVTIQRSFTAFASKEKVHAELFEMFGWGDKRRDFCHKRLMSILEAEREAQSKGA